MKSFLCVVFVVAIAWALAGCGPEKVKGVAPKLVGQWEWSNPAGGTWRLTISQDGTFQREMVDSAKAKSIVVHGSWSMFEPREKEQSWLERHRPFQKNPADELTRKAGYDPAKNKVQWSAPGLLSLHYSTSAPAPKATGGTASPEPKDSNAPPAAATQEVVIGETEAVRTYTDLNTGDVFLDLEGKTYKKVMGTAATASPEAATPEPEAAVKGTPAPSTPSLATPEPAATATPGSAGSTPASSAALGSVLGAPNAVTPIRATRGVATPAPAMPKHAGPTPLEAIPAKPGASS
jgi:hypothetical protein